MPCSEIRELAQWSTCGELGCRKWLNYLRLTVLVSFL